MAELNNEKLKQALGIVAEEEFKNLSDELPFTPSQEFEKKMEKLIKRAKKPYYKYTSTGMRRAICVIAAIFVLMLSTLTVSAVRDTVDNFFVRIFSSQKDNNENKVNKPKDKAKDEISVPENNNSEDKTEKPTIKITYELGYIPDGFELASYNNTGYEAKTEYFNDKDKIILTQYAKGSYSKTIDDETTFKDVEIIDNQKYTIYTSTYSSEITVVWVYSDYIFTLYSTLPKDDVITLCESIKAKEPSNYQDTINKIYELDEMPDGFELIDYSIDSNKVLYVYSFDNQTLTFTQNVKFSYNSPQDGNATKSIEIYNNQEYTIYTWGSGKTNIEWNNKEYIFSVESTLSKEEILSLCTSISVVSERKYTETIENAYKLEEVPDGFKLTDFKQDEAQATTKYSSTNGYLRFKQYANSDYCFGDDIENTQRKLKIVDGQKYMVYTFDDSDNVMIFFENEGYVFSIRSSLSENDIINLSKSIKIGEPKKDKPEKTTKKNNNKDKETTTRKEAIEKIYELGFLPEGYSLIDYAPETSNISYVYYLDDKMLMFSQNLSSSYSSSVDKQTAIETIEIHNNQEYTIYTWESGDINIIWNNGEFIFDLFGNLDKETALNMCKSIKIKEN
ncbi:MAG: DUF4367 domain-containing protein [Clostridia bacterium]|nr:DUF4367 domain-containing protein [Clostridia bacterium]